MSTENLFETIAVDLVAAEFFEAVEAGDIPTVTRIMREARA